MFNFFISLFGQNSPGMAHQNNGKDRRTPEMPVFIGKCNCIVKLMVW